MYPFCIVSSSVVKHDDWRCLTAFYLQLCKYCRWKTSNNFEHTKSVVEAAGDRYIVTFCVQRFISVFTFIFLLHLCVTIVVIYFDLLHLLILILFWQFFFYSHFGACCRFCPFLLGDNLKYVQFTYKEYLATLAHTHMHTGRNTSSSLQPQDRQIEKKHTRSPDSLSVAS